MINYEISIHGKELRTHHIDYMSYDPNMGKAHSNLLFGQHWLPVGQKLTREMTKADSNIFE